MFVQNYTTERIFMKRYNLSLSDETIKQLDEIKNEHGASRSATVRIAVEKHFNSTKKGTNDAENKT